MDSERLRLYWVWCAMRYRCSKPTDPAYENYGGRGIKVCDRWNNFQTFCDDMGPRPEGGLLEREDNDGNYDPDNCYWANRIQQNNNRRNNIMVEFRGETITLANACRIVGLPYKPVRKRVRMRGWSVERALRVPIGVGRTRNLLDVPIDAMLDSEVADLGRVP